MKKFVLVKIYITIQGDYTIFDIQLFIVSIYLHGDRYFTRKYILLKYLNYQRI